MDAIARGKRAWADLCEAVYAMVEANPGGITASEIGNAMEFQNAFRGAHNGGVPWTALGHLMRAGRVSFDPDTKLYAVRRS